jgi:hypothetical protein
VRKATWSWRMSSTSVVDLEVIGGIADGYALRRATGCLGCDARVHEGFMVGDAYEQWRMD